MLKLWLIKAYAKVLWYVLTPKTRKFKIEGDVVDIKDVAYTMKAKKHLALDIHYLKENQGSLPIVIYIHGGGWSVGDKFGSTGFCRKLADMGYLVFNINYGLGPKYLHPEPLIHVNQAIEWVSNNCANYKGDLNKMFLMGDSAGAHLASLAACAYTKQSLGETLGIKKPSKLDKLAGLVLFYGVYDFDNALESGFPLIKESIMGYIGTADVQNYPKRNQISPINHITKDYPPIFLTSGEIDFLHQSQTMAFIKELESKKIYHDVLIFDKDNKDGAHGYSIWAKNSCSIASLKAIHDFIEKLTKR